MNQQGPTAEPECAQCGDSRELDGYDGGRVRKTPCPCLGPVPEDQTRQAELAARNKRGLEAATQVLFNERSKQ